MRRIRLTVAYDGTNYCGWQIQPNGITIEEVLNKAICKLTGEEIQVIGASRTDSGVHARGNIAVFDTESRIPAERFSYALNQRLPKDIVVVKSDEVDLNWHPRYQDTLKTYEYHIINTKVPIPTERLYNYFVSFDLDVEQMRRGAAYLVGEHDFAPFCCIRTNAKTTVRTITDLQILQSGEHITIRISSILFLVFLDTFSVLPWITFDTVVALTPAIFATSLILIFPSAISFPHLLLLFSLFLLSYTSFLLSY